MDARFYQASACLPHVMDVRPSLGKRTARPPKSEPTPLAALSGSSALAARFERGVVRAGGRSLPSSIKDRRAWRTVAKLGDDAVVYGQLGIVAERLFNAASHC